MAAGMSMVPGAPAPAAIPSRMGMGAAAAPPYMCAQDGAAQAAGMQQPMAPWMPVVPGAPAAMAQPSSTGMGMAQGGPAQTGMQRLAAPGVPQVAGMFAAAAPPQVGMGMGMAGMPSAHMGMSMGMGTVGVSAPVYAAQGGSAPMTGMQHLMMLPAVDIQEKANVIEEVTAMLGMEIEFANRYHVLDRAGNKLFYAVESTDCLKRQMQNSCCRDCVAWDVDVFYTPPQALHQTFVKLSRPCQFSCCCLSRPVAEVVDQTTNQKLGSFRDPCTCCQLNFQIRDAEDRDVLRVNGGFCCFQPGFWCPLPCGPCSEVSFRVEDVENGQQVATISKHVPSILSWCFAPDVDNYKVEFEKVQAPQWKALLISLAIFMDFRYFNTNRNTDAGRKALQSGRQCDQA